MNRLLRPAAVWALAGLVLALSLVLIPLAFSAPGRIRWQLAARRSR